MLIGLDFDNTIVCYDRAIAELAKDIPNLPTDLAHTKLALRDYLRSESREEQWTAFQGTLYGPGMYLADPFDGAISAMQELEKAGHQLVIVSHRSIHPYAGPKYDLHAAARSWVAKHLQSSGLFHGAGIESPINFLRTQEGKVKTIARLGCAVFLDDLPELLDASDFPAKTLGILFDPKGGLPGRPERLTVQAWTQLPALIAQLA